MKLFLFFLLIVSLAAGCADPYSPTGAKNPLLPQISAVSPADGAKDVSLNTAMTVSFSKEIDPLTLIPQAVRLYDGMGIEISGSLTAGTDNKSVIFTPAALLKEGSTYQVYVSRIIKDKEGIPLDINAQDGLFRASFTTEITVPTVSATVPADKAEVNALELNAVTITFSESMDSETINKGNIFVTDAEGALTFDAAQKQAVFTFSEPLKQNWTYRIVVSRKTADLSGVELADDVIAVFTTK